MPIRLLFIASCIIALSGCSSLSKVTSGFSERRKMAAETNNPEQMRVSVDSAIFQPIVRVEAPQFSGLQTPLVGGGRSRGNTTERPITLPRFTAVTVLSNNGRYALVQIKKGQRGFLPSASIASESAILATAQPATLANPVSPLNSADEQALYLPQMDAGDAPVDEAMLNNIDSIPLPESEKHAPQTPEGQDVDGVVLRSAHPATADTQ